MPTVRSEAEGAIDHNLPVCRPFTEVMGVQQLQTLLGTTLGLATVRLSCLKKNLDASRPSEHPPVRGGNVKTFT